MMGAARKIEPSRDVDADLQALTKKFIADAKAIDPTILAGWVLYRGEEHKTPYYVHLDRGAA